MSHTTVFVYHFVINPVLNVYLLIIDFGKVIATNINFNVSVAKTINQANAKFIASVFIVVEILRKSLKSHCSEDSGQS